MSGRVFVAAAVIIDSGRSDVCEDEDASGLDGVATRSALSTHCQATALFVFRENASDTDLSASLKLRWLSMSGLNMYTPERTP